MGKKDEKRPTVLAKHLVSMTPFGQVFSLSLIQFGQKWFFTAKKLGRESAGIRRETAGIRRETARSQIWTVPFSGYSMIQNNYNSFIQKTNLFDWCLPSIQDFVLQFVFASDDWNMFAWYHQFWLKDADMSFVSHTRSSETLARGLSLVRAPDMSFESDPSPEEMEQELQRLLDP